MREDATKRRFLAARGGAARGRTAFCRTEIMPGALEGARTRIVNHFDWRGLEQLLEPWRCVQAGRRDFF